ncbi:MAG: acyltransferase family protein [Micrococcaceae bacterium]
MINTVNVQRSVVRNSRKYIPGLDGLRAIAVLAVVFYHLNHNFPKGGYIGVDIFFVISGFLITTLLVNEYYYNGRIDFKNFWLRRARRLIPALIVVIFVSIFFAFISFHFFRGHDLLVGIGRQTLGAATFSNNWLEIIKGTSYFNSGSPLLFVNFWSLAVEEQFYLIWPFIAILILVKTQNVRVRAGLAAAFGVISAILMAVMYTPGADSTRVYYGTDTHVFGLMFGACLAFIHTNHWYFVRRVSPLTHSFYRKIRVLLALFLLPVLAIFIFNLDSKSSFTYRGGLVLVSVITALIISALPGPKNILNILFETKVLKWVGERSYGIYLWHWPIIVIVGTMLPKQSDPNKVNWWQYAISLVLTLVFSALSYTFLETPIRKYGFKWLFVKAKETLTTQRGRARFAVATITAVALAGTMVAAIIQAPAKTQAQITIEQAQEQATKAKQAQLAAQKAAAAAQQKQNSNAMQQYEAIKKQALANGQPAPPTPDTRAGIPAGNQITVIGDSVTVASSLELMSTFPGVDVDGDVGRSWVSGVSDIQDRLSDGKLRKNVVVALGTNGLVTQDQIESLVKQLGNRNIVLVHAFGERDWIPATNQAMDAVAAKHKNVAIAKWDQDISGHQDLLATDGIHPSGAGGAIYAKSIANAFIQISNNKK